MAASRIELNWPNILTLLKDPAILADIERRAKQMADAAGEGFEVDSLIGKLRGRSVVRTVTKKAAVDQAKDNILLRSLDAARNG